MIAYQVTVTTLFVLGLVQQYKNFRLQVQYGQSRVVVALYVVGMLISVGMIVWTWLL